MIERGLTIKNPWAWMAVSGFKIPENRSWATSYRGRIAIHTSISFEWVDNEDAMNELCDAVPLVDEALCDPRCEDRDLLWYGYVIGTAEIVGVERLRKNPTEDDFKVFDKYAKFARYADIPAWQFAAGPHCIMLANAERFAYPVPLKGRVNLFRLDSEEQRLIEIARKYLLTDPAEPPVDSIETLVSPSV